MGFSFQIEKINNFKKYFGGWGTSAKMFLVPSKIPNLS